MKVSVAVITYNHEKFIAQAIEGILMQLVDFEYEIIIGEDCSTDKTRNIVLEYKNRFPDRIKLLLKEKNVGMMENFIQAIKACRGQYVALCEGDDYWTSPQKLQAQVNFLEGHPDYAICFHNAMEICEDRSRGPKTYCSVNQKLVPSFEDLLLKNFIPTCSVMFRRGLFNKIPDWWYNLRMGDWPLHIFNAQHGKIRYLNEVMAVYRVHSGGLWSSVSETQHYKDIIVMLDCVKAYFGVKYEKQIKASKAKAYYRLADAYANCGDLVNAEVYLKKSFVESPFNNCIPRIDWSKMLLRIYVPTLYHHLKNLKLRVRPQHSSILK